MDGDDSWTNNGKLRRQAAFLDSHPDVSMCFHDVLIVNKGGHKIGGSGVWAEMPWRLGLREIVAGNHVPTCSAVVRREAVDPLPPWYRDAEFGDWPLWIAAAKVGSLAFNPGVFGARRVHPGGMWTARPEAEQVDGILRFLAQVEAGGLVDGEPALAVTRAVWELRRAQIIGDVAGALAGAEGLDRLFRNAGTSPRLQRWYRYWLD